LRKSPLEIIQRIYESLESRTELNISGLSKKSRINRRTVTAYLDLIKWVKTKPYIFERQGKRGARIFSLRFTLKKTKEFAQPPLETTRGLSYALAQFARITDVLELPKEASEEALNIYSKYVKELFFECEKLEKSLAETMVAATIYYVCRKHPDLPSLGRIAHAFRIVDKEIEPSFKALDEAIRIDGRFQLQSYVGISREGFRAGITLPREHFYELLALRIQDNNKDAVCFILPANITILAPQKLIIERDALEKIIGEVISDDTWFNLVYNVEWGVFGRVVEASSSNVIVVA
jgi:hypothetical protein